MYNSGKTIASTLEGLQKQSVNGYEVIVIDDGSSDASAKIVSDFILKSAYPLILLNQKNSGPAKARNVGAGIAKGELLIFLDSDCITPENWIEEMTRPVHGKTIGSNCGYKVQNGQFLIARYIGFEIARRHERMIDKKINTSGTYSACFKKAAFFEAGGFDTMYRNASGEDFDLAFNIHKKGYEIFFTGATFVFHTHPDTLGKYLRQQFWRGYWRFSMYLKHRQILLKGDSYTGMEAQTQFILSNLVFLSVLFLFFSPIPIIFSTGLLILSNVPLGIWTFKKERKFLIIAPFIASMRSLAGSLGVYRAVIDASLKRSQN